ncbi:hypothetical protein Rsub_03035 [Raphidocelis subcapitata]|uniref:Uncharacterized protein n=1 Tax=Raphidocelis subcapitata TaxID=307507 RepID=A0A2V0NSX8_9CHLO|nr:hypothetical protein Rsub_03035 [Raphidocelis subcapitata]|eukprot:GBF90734.1 hypothetical protein Rsub_03035 [Raphidocelis subcapitata]
MIEEIEAPRGPVGDFEAKEDGEQEHVSPRRRRKLLTACLCILGTELCERMAFIGIATNLSLYLKQYLGYSAASASQLLQVFKGTVFVTPLIGGYLADAHFGRFRTILAFSAVYLVGLLGITAVNAAPSTRPRRNAPPDGGYGPTTAAFWAFMYLIALGSGGIKPCVSSFGGDQFRDGSAQERRYRSSFFNWFYFVINLGSLIAALVVTPVQEMRGYAIGFGIPAAVFVAALALFVGGAGARLYAYVPPEGSPLRRLYQVFKCALITNARKPVPSDPSQLHDPPLGSGNVAFRMGRTPRYRRLERAALPHGRPGRYQPSLAEVEEAKALLSLGPFLLLAVLFRIGCDPISTLLPFTGDSLQRGMGAIKVPAASMSFANQLAMLASLLAYDFLVVPLARRRGWRITAMQRIGFGIILQILALLSAGFIEVARYRILARTGIARRFARALALNPKLAAGSARRFTVPMSIWWHVIPHAFEGVSETFVNAAVVEIFFTQVSEGTRSLANSLLLLAVGLSSYLAFGLNKAVAAATKSDPWISQNPFAGHYDWYMFLNAGIAMLALVVFFWVARCYRERPLTDGEAMSLAELKLSADAGEEVAHHHTHAPGHANGHGHGHADEGGADGGAPSRQGSSALMLGGGGPTSARVDSGVLQQLRAAGGPPHAHARPRHH